MRKNPEQVNVSGFTIHYKGIVNTLITDARIASPILPHQADPHAFVGARAVWDTGAAVTCITVDLAQKCGLEPVGTTRAYTASGETLAPTYLVAIELPNRILIRAMLVNGAKLPGDIDMLIGMDVINKGDFAVTNFAGRTMLSFRIPSIQQVDFNPNVRRVHGVNMPPKIGRNEPCWCGSGKKYKNCHGRLD